MDGRKKVNRVGVGRRIGLLFAAGLGASSLRPVRASAQEPALTAFFVRSEERAQNRAVDALQHLSCPAPQSRDPVVLRAWVRAFGGYLPARSAAPQVFDQSTVVEREGVLVERVVYEGRIGGRQILAWYAHSSAAGDHQPTVIVVHGPGTLAHQALRIRAKGADSLIVFDSLATLTDVTSQLIRSGFAVLSVQISDDVSHWPRLPWNDLDKRVATAQSRGLRFGPLSGPLGALSAAIDFVKERSDGKIVVLGYGQSAQLASVLAVTDARVDVVIRMAPPIDRPRWRRERDGVAAGPAILAWDCAIGEEELEALGRPKPLAIVWDESITEHTDAAARVDHQVLDRIRSAYSSARLRFFWSSAEGKERISAQGLVRWVTDVVGSTGLDEEQAAWRGEVIVTTYPAGLLLDARVTLDRVLVSSGACDDATSWRRFTSTRSAPGPEGLRAYLSSAGVQGERQIRADSALDAAGNMFFALEATGAWPSMTVVAVPAGVRVALPVLVAMNGGDGLAKLFGAHEKGAPEYLNGYADVALRAGVAVVAPLRPQWFPETLAALSSGRGLGVGAVWPKLAGDASIGLEAAGTLFDFDSTRVTAYGIAYGGYLALLSSYASSKVTRVVYSNPVNTPSVLFRSDDAAVLDSWLQLACPLVEPALAFRGPVPLLWENGIQDTNGYFSESPLEFVSLVERGYARLGAVERFIFKRIDAGHVTRPDFELLEFILR